MVPRLFIFVSKQDYADNYYDHMPRELGLGVYYLSVYVLGGGVTHSEIGTRSSVESLFYTSFWP